jgi:uncharacterized protein (DUF849 family)
MEDNIYIRRGQLTKGNGELVEAAVKILDSLGGEPATPDEARAMLELPPR